MTKSDSEKPRRIYNPDFIAVMDDEITVYVKGLIDERDKLKADLAVAIAALENICHPGMRPDGVAYGAIELAKAALAKLSAPQEGE